MIFFSLHQVDSESGLGEFAYVRVYIYNREEKTGSIH